MNTETEDCGSLLMPKQKHESVESWLVQQRIGELLERPIQGGYTEILVKGGH